MESSKDLKKYLYWGEEEENKSEKQNDRDVLKKLRSEVVKEFMQNQLGKDAGFCFTVCQTNGTEVSA